MQLTIIPLGTATTSVGKYVAEVQEFLHNEGAAFTLTDMGTVIEGEVSELLALAAKVHELPFLQGAKRVVTQIALDDRRDKTVHIGDKTKAVQNRLQS